MKILDNANIVHKILFLKFGADQPEPQLANIALQTKSNFQAYHTCNPQPQPPPHSLWSCVIGNSFLFIYNQAHWSQLLIILVCIFVLLLMPCLP